MAENRRLKRVLVTAPLVLDFLRHVREDFASSLPSDARAVRVYADPENDGFQFIVESETFEPIREGEAIPLLEVTVQKK
jgi:hypothetical protein